MVVEPSRGMFPSGAGSDAHEMLCDIILEVMEKCVGA